ncbi:MAG TPA: hypothetical protein VGM19_06115 [Armatimonadota bacterium]|jgi:hypothetical protein
MIFSRPRSRALPSRRLRLSVAVGGLLLLLGLVDAPGEAAPLCSISAARPARAFYPGERIVLSLQVAGPLLGCTYQVTDYYGHQSLPGYLRVGKDIPRALALGIARDYGVFYLSLEFSNGATQRDAYCVLPRPDAQPGDYGPFSWHFSSDRRQDWCALAQVGCRLIRRDMDWVSLQTTPGPMDLTKARVFATLAQEYGMQLIPILGYSPRWAGLRPVNATGRAAVATHTWPPASTGEWRKYVSALVEYLGPMRVAWPPRAALAPQQASQTDSLPLVHSWEIWNEVDQNFYYGYWGRYLDLLRIAHGEIKRGDPAATVLYGGSCGHWTELGMTYKTAGQFFFDRLSIHPGGTDFDQVLENYYTGAPQIGNGYGLYRPTTMTESYPFCPANLTEAQYMLRLYTVLRKWPVDTFCAYDGGRVIGDPDVAAGVAPTDFVRVAGEYQTQKAALLWQPDKDNLAPNAKYVALAVARWLLSDAAYTGPVQLADGVQAQLFLAHSYPVVVCWADTPTVVTLRAGAGATVLDEMGKATPLTVAGGRTSFTVGPAPRVLRGLDRSYLAEAITRQAELYLGTPQGFASTRPFGYLGTLERDAAWAGGDWGPTFRAALATATRAVTAQPVRGGPLLGLAQGEINAQISRELTKCQTLGSVNTRAQATVWRLETMSEWLGRVVDEYSWRWPQFRTPPGTLNQLQQAQDRLSLAAADPERGLTRPLTEQSLRRSRDTLSRVGAAQGPGSYRAARGMYLAASLYAQLEPPVLTGVTVAPDFVTATQLVKALTLIPGQTHEISCLVHNYTPQPVSGTLTLTLSEAWTPEPASLPFSVAAGGVSEPLVFRFTLPGGPQPWPLVSGVTPPGEVVPLRRPGDLSGSVQVMLGGALSDGRALLPTICSLLVGEYVPPA